MPAYTFPMIFKAKKAFAEGPNTIVIGAGVSSSAGLPGWKKLIKDMLVKSGSFEQSSIDSDYERIFKNCGYSDIVIGRLLKKMFADKKGGVSDVIHELMYGRQIADSEIIKTICRIIKNKRNLIKEVITYNFDDLIEQELDKLDVEYFSMFGNSELGASLPICHVHGMLPQNKLINSSIVFSEDEYHDMYKEAYHWSNVEQLHAFRCTNCFFIGLSMTDPNMRRLLDIAKIDTGLDEQEPKHFVFMYEGDFNDENGKINKEYLQKQENLLRDLGVGTIWYDNYDDLPNLLYELL